MKKKEPRSLFPLLKQSVNTFIAHPSILFPFLTIAFIQLLILEILFFAVRFPLDGFFKPIIQTVFGVPFIHYPNNFLVLPKMFQFIQIPLYVFVTSFLICVAVGIVAAINEEKPVKFSSAFRGALRQYVHIFLAALLSIFVFFLLHRGYNLVMLRAAQITSTQGVFFILKSVVLVGSPYFSLLIGVFIVTLFAFVFPVIIIEKRGIFPALWINLKHLWGSFIFVFFLVLVPTIFYLAIMFLRSALSGVARAAFPEVSALILVASIFVTMFIDATVYTALTIFYLLKKEKL